LSYFAPLKGQATKHTPEKCGTKIVSSVGTYEETQMHGDTGEFEFLFHDLPIRDQKGLGPRYKGLPGVGSWKTKDVSDLGFGRCLFSLSYNLLQPTTAANNSIWLNPNFMTKDNSYHCFYADEKIDNFERMALAEASDKKFVDRMPSDPTFGLASNSKVLESGRWPMVEGGLWESIEENEGNSISETGQSGSRIQMISPLPALDSIRESFRVQQGLSPRKKTMDSYELEGSNSGYIESQPDLDKKIQLPEKKDINHSIFSTPPVKKLPQGQIGKNLPIKGRNLAHSFGSDAPFLSHMQKPSWTMHNFGSKKIGSPLFYLKNNDLHFRDMDLKAELGSIKLIDFKDLENSCASSTIGMPNPIFRDDVLNMSTLTTFKDKFLLQFELKS
jgi:hypothetical protein